MMDHHEQATEEHPLAMLYQKYATIILVSLNRRLPLKEDAEDLLLEVFLAALASQIWTRGTEREQLAWLRRVARNKLVDYYRRNERRAEILLPQLPETLDADEDLLPEPLAIRQEEQLMLSQSIVTLPRFQQDLLRLRFAHGLPTKEIALRLEKSDSAIRNLLSRTLNHLRRLYDQQRGV